MVNHLIEIIGAGAIGVLTTILGILAMKRKTNAETENLEIEGETNIGEAWAKYAAQMKKDKDEIRNEFSGQMQKMQELHTKEIDAIKKEFELRLKEKDVESKKKDERITVLEKQVGDLQMEVAKYKNLDSTLDNAKIDMHLKVDEAAHQLKENIHAG